MFNLISQINGYVSIIPYNIENEMYLKVDIKHYGFKITKFIHNKVTWDDGFCVYVITKMLLEILNKEENDGD